MTNKETLLPITIKIGPFKNSGDFSITNSYKNLGFLCSVGFCFLPFFVLVFISCSFDLVCFLQLMAIEKRLPIFSDRRQISLQTPTMRLTKRHHGKLNGQNRNKMGEDRQRKLTAIHQQFVFFVSVFILCLFRGDE